MLLGIVTYRIPGMHTPEVHEWGQIFASCGGGMFVRFWDVWIRCESQTKDTIGAKGRIQTNVSLWGGKNANLQ